MIMSHALNAQICTNVVVCAVNELVVVYCWLLDAANYLHLGVSRTLTVCI